MYLKPVLCIVYVFYVVGLSNSIRILDLQLNTVSSILKLIKDLNNESVIKSVEDSRNKDGFFNAKTQFDLTGLSKDNIKDDIANINKVLVKRIVPHGSKYNDIEYGEGIFYRPLVRIHKKANYENSIENLNSNLLYKVFNINNRKPLSNRIQSGIQKKNSYYNKEEHKQLLKLLSDTILPHGLKQSDTKYDGGTSYRPLDRIHKKADDDLNNRIPLSDKKHSVNPKQNSYYSKEEYKQLLRLLKDVTRVIKMIHNKEARYKAYEKVVSILKKIDVLRTKVEEKSDEELAPGFQVVGDTPAQAEVLPHYPPWNYWTYKKTIHQDQCPNAQVKVGNMCIWTPPH